MELPTELLLCIGEVSDIATRVSLSKIYGNEHHIIKTWGKRRFIRRYALQCVNESNPEELKLIMSFEGGNMQYIRPHLFRKALDKKDLTCSMLLLKHFETQKCKEFSFKHFQFQLIRTLLEKKNDKPKEVSRFTVYLLKSCYEPWIMCMGEDICKLVTAPFHYCMGDKKHLSKFRKDLRRVGISPQMINTLVEIRKKEIDRRSYPNGLLQLVAFGAQDLYLMA